MQKKTFDFVCCGPNDRVLHVGPGCAFADLESARNAVRELPERGRKPVRVWVHDGVYSLSRPFVLRPEDSGTPRAPVVYQAAPGASPQFSGGIRLSGWRLGRIRGLPAWRLDLGGMGLPEGGFTQLYVNGCRRPRTRLPREGFFRFRCVEPGKRVDRAGFHPGDLRPWRNLDDVEIIAPHYWVDSHLRIRAVDMRRREVRFAAPTVMRLNDERGEGTSRYWVENVAEALDTAGQWYLDRARGILTYLPLAGEDPDDSEVFAPVLSALVRFEGEPSDGCPPACEELHVRPPVVASPGDVLRRMKTFSTATVHDVHLVGLHFQHTGWNYPDGCAGAGQAAWTVPGVIRFDHATDCSIRLCSVSLTENYAVELSTGTRDVTVMANRLDDLGAGGIKLGHDSHFNRVSDNIITRGGRRFPSAVGIWIGHSGDNRVEYNQIRDFFYTGISVGWVWGFAPSAARRNRIENNVISRIGQGLLSDMGGIYSLGVSPGTRIAGNRIHDVRCYGYGASGLYPDEGSAFITYADNVVWDTGTGTLSMNYGRDCHVINNVLVEGGGPQIQWGTPKFLRPFRFERNVVLFRRGGLLAGVCLDGMVQIEFERNVYWREDGRMPDFAGVDWTEWRARGFDRQGTWADPLVIRDGEEPIALRADSPARLLGFKPPSGNAGPRPSAFSHGDLPLPRHRPAPCVWSRIECVRDGVGLDAEKGMAILTAYPDRTPCQFMVRVVFENAGDAVFDAEVGLQAMPTNALAAHAGIRRRLRLASGASESWEMPLSVREGVEEVVVKTVSRGRGFGASSLGFGFRPEARAMRLPADVEVTALADFLAPVPSVRVSWGNQTLGSFRLGVAGKRLALDVDVTAARIERTDPCFRGSMIDLFGLTAGAPGTAFGQAFLVPAGSGKAAALLQTDMTPVTDADVLFSPTKRGYRMQALLPLKALNIRVIKGEFAFLGAIYTHLPGRDAIVQQHLFNQRPRNDLHAYGVFRIETIR